MDIKPMPLPLELVLNVITCSLPKYPNVLLSPSHPITQTLLSFTLVCHETRRVANRALLKHCAYFATEYSIRSFLLQIPGRPDLRKLQNLFLAPFVNIDDQPMAHWVRELFQYTSASLKRLIIDIPLRNLYPEDDHLDVRRILREGFLSLENLEEFVSVRDELFLDTIQHSDEPAVWKKWSALKRLALYNVDADEAFWSDIARMPQLQTLVLTRADGLRECNIKNCYSKFSKGRAMKVLLINVATDQVGFSQLLRNGWDYADPEKKMTIMTYNIPSLYADEGPIEVCQDFVRAGAENGTLWGWDGEIIQHPPKFAPRARARLLD
ncbi:hypothetical protein BU24DRAFT_425269 [Aaosphaeria arxii CBS 175.79]|uniref:F-box domain-containing protein n=1 Tax=Aaosphaeria arxii CBS 175.79 TaxID=1450172 RepID=A0A6A5XIH5_9PLEO|nr:uncharacterized protein BU24DRAFT_425269 [Aaosphaeria arxii CBS 175.79]KAF2012631.1 hypothetical protein BU24DRAFT_425269 [Aaosphaeria arxii CBS 175.79]